MKRSPFFSSSSWGLAFFTVVVASGASIAGAGCGGNTSSSSPSDAGGRDATSVDASGCVGRTNAPLCPGACGGQVSPVCENGQLVCPPEPEIARLLDSGLDASDGSIAHGDGGIACGPLTCDDATEYCLHTSGGAQPPDGGSTDHYSCPTIPACDGATGCACVSNGCFCDDDAGAIVVTCDFP